MALTINGTDGIETNTDTGKLKFGTGDDLQIHHDGTQSVIETNSSATKPLHLKGDPIWFYKSGSSELFCKMVADSSVELYHDGSKKLETISTGVNITGGIRLGGNNDANQIEDYETGTFTPRMGGNSNIGTYNITGSGNYIKIGDMCHVMIYFADKDLDNSASGTAIIDQLPFTSLNSSIVAGITTNFHTYKVLFSQDQRYTFYVSGNTTSWKGLVSRNDETWANWAIEDFENWNMYLEFHGSYRTA